MVSKTFVKSTKIKYHVFRKLKKKKILSTLSRTEFILILGIDWIYQFRYDSIQDYISDNFASEVKWNFSRVIVFVEMYNGCIFEILWNFSSLPFTKKRLLSYKMVFTKFENLRWYTIMTRVFGRWHLLYDTREVRVLVSQVFGNLMQ